NPLFRKPCSLIGEQRIRTTITATTVLSREFCGRPDLEFFQQCRVMSRLFGYSITSFGAGEQCSCLMARADVTGRLKSPQVPPKTDPSHRRQRSYEGTDAAEKAMQAYLDWEYGLVAQLRRDDTHGFFVI